MGDAARRDPAGPGVIDEGGPKIRRAILSVSDKTGLTDFARALDRLGVEIVSTGGTAALLAAEGVRVTPVEKVTGFAEMLDGRVRTLHPNIHGGILANRGDARHRETLERHGIEPFDLVVVNFYPFRRALEGDLPDEEATELIDIGGPTLLRAAAKNAHQVAPVPSPRWYAGIVSEMEASGGRLSGATRDALRRETFLATAEYDATVARYLGRGTPSAVPDPFPLHLAGGMPLRYGENPQQIAALFPPPAGEGALPWRVLGGKALSYNNLVDLDAAARLVQPLRPACVAIVKHTNPCGVARGATPVDAYRRAREADPVSSFGGIVAANRPVDDALAAALGETFLEAVLAPAFGEGALATLSAKKNLRLVEAPALADPEAPLPPLHEVRGTLFGWLVQTADGPDPLDEWRAAAGELPSGAALEDARFAWHVARRVSSNAIVLARDGRVIGVGAGQMNRLESVRLALAASRRAGFDPAGSALASDAFFPFPDGVEAALGEGVRLFVQPGGSVRDDEVVRAAASAGATMILTGRRHFRH